MKWVKQGTKWVAKGENGRFIITYSCGKYFARYTSNSKVFNLPPCKSIKMAKEICQDNFYWEE